MSTDWMPSMQLRFVVRTEPTDDGEYRDRLILQQLWVSPWPEKDQKNRWIDIPTDYTA